MVKNTKIGFKLIGGYGVVVFLFVCVMVIYQYTLYSTTNNFKDLMRIDVAIAGHASQVDILMMQCRSNERQFLSSLDRISAAKLEKNCAKLIETATIVIGLAKQSGNSNIIQNAKNIIANANAYLKDFKKAVAACEAKGLDKTSGLLGQFNKITENFTKTMLQFECEDAYIEVLRLTRFQNEYRITRDKKTAQKLLASASQLHEIVVKYDDESPQVVMKDAIIDILPDYEKIFQKYQKAQDASSGNKHYKAMKELTQEMEEIFANTYVQRVREFVLEVRQYEKDYLLTGEKKYISATHRAIDELFSAVKNSGVSEMFVDEADQFLEDYKKAFDKLVAADQEIAKIVGNMQKAANRIAPLMEGLNRNAGLAAADREKIVKAQVKKRSLFAVLIGILAIGFGILLSSVISKSISSPMNKVVDFANNLAKGDLTQDLDIHRTDEIGFLANNLNEMVTNVNRLFKSIAEDIHSLSLSSSELTDISQQMANGSQETSEKSNTVASAAETMTANFTSVTTSMEKTSSNVGIVASAAEEMTASINEIVTSSEAARNISENAVSQAENVSRKMAELGRSAVDIGKVTETINDISEQTNLLALNATIEASRAGDAGRGFGVVANEIKELASKTATATKEIKNQIDGIQKVTDSTELEIGQITKVINNIDEIIATIASAIQEQSLITKEIAENAANMSHGINEVSGSMTRSSSMAGEISKDIADVNSAATQMLNSSSQINISSEGLAKIAEKLQTAVGWIKFS